MKFYTLSPSSVPENQVLFPTMRPTFNEKGHEFVSIIQEADVAMMDLHSRISEYKQSDIDWLINSNLPVASFCEYDRGGMSFERWPNPLTIQQEQVFNYISRSGVKSVHFCRLLDKTKSYPENLYPYEKPILFEQEMGSADDIFNRPFDIVWIANSAPQRETLAKALRLDARLKVNIILGAKKIPYQDWIDEHKKGKLFISCSAGGYSNECVQSLFSVAGHIKERNDQLLAHPFTNGINCVSISEQPTKQEIDYLRLVVGNKDELFKIYKGCYDHMKAHYTKEAISNYILATILKHVQ